MGLKDKLLRMLLTPQTVRQTSEELVLRFAAASRLPEEAKGYLKDAEAILRLKKGIRQVETDLATGTVTLQLDQLKPEEALRWVNHVLDAVPGAVSQINAGQSKAKVMSDLQKHFENE